MSTLNFKKRIIGLSEKLIFISKSANNFRFREPHIITKEFDLESDEIFKAPVSGLRAKKIDGIWWWVCDCPTCLNKDFSFAYSLCEEHDVCDTCGKKRKDVIGSQWGTKDGWRCEDCEQKRKEKAINDYKKHIAFPNDDEIT